MSSDCYFDDDDDIIDPSLLNALDAIEAQHFSPSKKQPAPLTRTNSSSSNFFDDIDESELRRLDDFIENAYQGKVAPLAGPNTTRPSTKGTLQTTLFGDVLQPEASSSRAKASSSSASSLSMLSRKGVSLVNKLPRRKCGIGLRSLNLGGRKPPKTKGKEMKGKPVSGITVTKTTMQKRTLKTKMKRWNSNNSQPLLTFRSSAQNETGPDLLEAKQWIYPLNQPKRDYQFNIVKHSLFENTLVALPTGLGKTFVLGLSC